MDSGESADIYQPLLIRYLESLADTELVSILPLHKSVKEISNNVWIQVLWRFWCRQYFPKSAGVLESIVYSSEIPEVPSRQLQSLLATLKKASEIEKGQINAKAEQFVVAQKKLKESKVGQAFLAVSLLKDAAKMLNCNEDHFIRQIGVGEILSVDGETEDEYELRLLAVTNHHLIHLMDPLKTGKATSKESYTIRMVWPKMCVTFTGVKKLHEKPWVAITDLFVLFNPEFNVNSSHVRSTIERLKNKKIY